MCLPNLNDTFSAFSDNDVLNTSKICLYERKDSFKLHATSRGRFFSFYKQNIAKAPDITCLKLKIHGT